MVPCSIPRTDIFFFSSLGRRLIEREVQQNFRLLYHANTYESGIDRSAIVRSTDGSISSGRRRQKVSYATSETISLGSHYLLSSFKQLDSSSFDDFLTEKSSEMRRPVLSAQIITNSEEWTGAVQVLDQRMRYSSNQSMKNSERRRSKTRRREGTKTREVLGNLFRLIWITKKTKTPFSWSHDFVLDKEKSKNALKYQKSKPKEALKCQKVQKRIWQISTAPVHPPETSTSIYPGVRASVVEAAFEMPRSRADSRSTKDAKRSAQTPWTYPCTRKKAQAGAGHRAANRPFGAESRSPVKYTGSRAVLRVTRRRASSWRRNGRLLQEDAKWDATTPRRATNGTTVGDRHTVVTRSTSTYRTELSLCQQITSFPSMIAVSEEMLFSRCCDIDRFARCLQIRQITKQITPMIVTIARMLMARCRGGSCRRTEQCVRASS